MKFLLDTDICIYILNNAAPKLQWYFRKYGPARICLSTLSEAELYYGALHSSRPDTNRERVRKFVAPFLKLSFDSVAAQEFAVIKKQLVQKGCPIGSIDMLIAAIAKAHKLVLITNNLKHFKRIDGLKTANWLNKQ